MNPGFKIDWVAEPDGLLSLHDGIFEPAHWWPRRGDLSRSALFMWDGDNARSGTHSVSINTRRQDQATPCYEAWCSYVNAPELASRTVSLRVMVKTAISQPSAYATLRIHAFKDGIAFGTPCGASSAEVSGTRDWTKHSLTFVVPAEATYLMLQLGLYGRGRVWFDDVELRLDDDAIVSEASWAAHAEDDRMIQIDSAGIVRESLAAPSQPLGMREWNILMYAAADFEDGYAPLEDFTREIQSNSHTNVLVLEDTFGAGAAVWFVDRLEYSARLTCVDELGEPDLAEQETLEAFLLFARQWYPAKRTLLLVYGHGHAWWGACTDDSNCPRIEGTDIADWLRPSELRAAIEAAGGVDAIMFSAPCVMSSLEAVYEVRESTDLYVAAEELSEYIIWARAVGPIALSLYFDPDQGMEALAQTTIDAIRDGIQGMIASGAIDPAHDLAIAATRTADIAEVAVAVNAFALALIEALPEQRESISAAREAARTFVSGELVDVHHFAERCSGIPGVEDAAVHVMKAIQQAVLQILNTVESPQARGLSLYFPVLEPDAPESSLKLAFDVTGATYLNYDLALLADTHWYDFLQAYFADSDD